jgi:hypothetical protein
LKTLSDVVNLRFSWTVRRTQEPANGRVVINHWDAVQTSAHFKTNKSIISGN